MKNQSWFSHFISISEMRVSGLVLSFLAFSCIGVFLLIKHGDLPTNLTTFLISIAGIIGGVNAFNFVSNNIAMSRNNMQMPMQNNMYGYGSQYGYGGYNGYNQYSTYGNHGYGMNSGMGVSGMGMNTMQPIQSQVAPQTTPQSGSKPQDRPV